MSSPVKPVAPKTTMSWSRAGLSAGKGRSWGRIGAPILAHPTVPGTGWSRPASQPHENSGAGPPSAAASSRRSRSAAIVAAGVVADPSAGPTRRRRDRPHHLRGLRRARSWYVDAHRRPGRPLRVGRQGLDDAATRGADALSGQDDSSSGSGSTSAPQPGAERSAPQDAVANGATGTNTQEAGVDEPDVAKTDGRIVVRLLDGRRLVITDVTGTAPREVADWRLPGRRLRRRAAARRRPRPARRRQAASRSTGGRAAASVRGGVRQGDDAAARHPS